MATHRNIKYGKRLTQRYWWRLKAFWDDVPYRLAIIIDVSTDCSAFIIKVKQCKKDQPSFWDWQSKKSGPRGLINIQLFNCSTSQTTAPQNVQRSVKRCDLVLRAIVPAAGWWRPAVGRRKFVSRSVHAGFVVDKMVKGPVFILVLQFSAVNYHSTNPTYSFFTRWIVNRPITSRCFTQTPFKRHKHNSVSIKSPSNSRCVEEDKHVFQTTFP